MSQLKNKQTPTDVDLDAYNKVLKLASYSMEVCKPKQRKDNKGNFHDSKHHIPMRYSKIGEFINTEITKLGAMVLNANSLYVKENLNIEDRKANYNERIRLQTVAIAMTFEVEHCIRVLHDHRPFADSTIRYWLYLLAEAREGMIKWKDSDVKKRKKLG